MATGSANICYCCHFGRGTSGLTAASGLPSVRVRLSYHMRRPIVLLLIRELIAGPNLSNRLIFEWVSGASESVDTFHTFP